MISRILDKIRNNWKPILWGLIPILIIVIVFALPIKVVPIQVTETYWDTELRDEPYTVPESYTVTEPYTTTETRTETVYQANINSSNWSYSFNVNQPNTKVTIELNNTYSNYYPYTYWINKDQPYYFPWNYYYSTGAGKATIQISYPEEVTKYRTVTKTQDVVKYRQVPTQVLKERKVIQNVRMSLWAYLFYNKPL
jgi:hypothetical protein